MKELHYKLFDRYLIENKDMVIDIPNAGYLYFNINKFGAWSFVFEQISDVRIELTISAKTFLEELVNSTETE